MEGKILIALLVGVFLLSFVSAEIILVKPPIFGPGSLTNINTTQMEDSEGVLNILENWLSSLYCKLTGCEISGDLNVTGNVIVGTKDSPSYFKAFIGDGDTSNIALFSDADNSNGIMISTYAIDGVTVNADGDKTGWSDLYLQYWSTGDVYIAEEGGDIYMVGESGGGIGSNVIMGAGSGFFFDGTSGRLGIGTTNPTHKLNVVGNANITGDIYSNSFQVLSYNRTVDGLDVTMTAVI